MSGQVQEQAEVMGRGEQEGAFSDEQVPLPRCWLEMTREDPADDLTPPSCCFLELRAGQGARAQTSAHLKTRQKTLLGPNPACWELRNRL